MNVLLMIVIMSFPITIVDHTGFEHEWIIEIVDEICNDVNCVAGITHAYPVAKIQLDINQMYFVDKYGCYVIYHEWLHMLYGDWYHQWIHEKYC